MSIRRIRKAVVSVAVLVMVGGGPFSAGRADAHPAAWPREAARAEAAFVDDINRLRASRGLPALRVRPNLTSKARGWAATMAAARRIWHSRISAGVTGRWRKLGENVGRGPSEARLHEAFTASSTHLENLVDPAFKYVGVGVVLAPDGRMFVSEVFMQPATRASRRVHGPSPTARGVLPVHQEVQERPSAGLPIATPGLMFRLIR